MSITCNICDREVSDVPAAIEADWIPNFFVGKEEYEAACPECVQRFLTLVNDEFELKAGLTLAECRKEAR